MDTFEKEEHKKEAERNRIHQQKLATLTVFAALVGLTIALLGVRDYFPPTCYSLVIILLIAMFFVLIFGLYGSVIIQKLKYYSEKRRLDRLAKSYFEQFKRLVVRFKEFTEDRDDNIQTIVHNIKNSALPNPFFQIYVVQQVFIKERYNFYMKWLNQFNGTKDNLITLAEEFDSILYMYNAVYIKEPIQQIRNIGGDSPLKYYKQSYNKARQKYINFRMDYIKFVKDANEDFKGKGEDSGFLDGEIYFRDYFEQPDEL